MMWVLNVTASAGRNIHIGNIATKISRTVGLIAKLRHFVSEHTLLNIYPTLI